MSYQLIATGGKGLYNHDEWVVDTVEDLKAIPTYQNQSNVGSTAFVIEGSQVFILNSQRQWQKIGVGSESDDPSAEEIAVAAAQRANQAAITAGNYAAQAIQAKNSIEEKIWYGTIEEYNNLETVNSSTIYIILHE